MTVTDERPVAGHARQPRRRRLWSTWLATLAVLFPMSAAWSLATPLRASPDESAHITRAAAIVRGEWIGHAAGRGSSPAETGVRVPGTFALGGRLCYQFEPAVPAGCQPARKSSGVETTTATYVGHYPPLFYLAVGWPSLITSSTAAVYMMRMLSGLLCTGLVALAIASALRWSRSRLLAPAVAVSASPMAVFMGSTVNPSGLEIAGAICAWTAATIVVVDHPADPDRGLLAVATGSTMTLLLVRGLSPLWAALVVAFLLPLAWRRVDLARLLRRGDVRVCVAELAAASVASLGWIIFGRALTEVALAVPSRATTNATLAREILGQTGGLLRQAIGLFGFADTPAPWVTVVVWETLVLGLVALAVATGGRRAATTLGALAAASVLVPALLSYVSIRHVGPIAQGRYFMPLYVGIPIVAAAVVDDRRLSAGALGRLARLAWGGVAVGQVAAFYWTLRRFTVGFFGPLWPDAHVTGGWSPPLRPILLDAAVALLGGALYLLRGVPTGAWTPTRPDSGRPPEVSPTPGQVAPGSRRSPGGRRTAPRL